VGWRLVLALITLVYNPRDSPTHSVDACKTILAKDLNTYDMSQHFDETYAFISEQVDSNRNVLVHCHAGVSRSATILIAYLMKRNAWTLEKALSVVKSKRARAKPN
jgi:protein-tyrosine phosphatase